jgi:hypothetical protein
MSCFRFLTDNYADSNLYANIFKTSENSSFPVSSLLARVRRSKVWRSNGYFKIVSGSNTIVFRDASGGADKTATITVGEYTSTSSFMAAVDSAFEAVGAANYTITQNSNLKFVIASDLSGGATAFELRWASSTAMAGIMGFDTTNLSGASSYTGDFVRINTEERITFDLGLPTNITSFAMTGFRNSALKLSPSGVFKLQGSSTNAWTSPEYSTTLSYDDEIIGSLSESGLHTGPLRYWSVQFVDQNPNGYVELGSIMLGNHYAPTRGAAQFPFRSSLVDRSSIDYSEGGQSFSDVQEQTQDFIVDWNGLTKTELEELLSIFEAYGKHYPFFVSMDSDAIYSSSFNKMLKVVKFIDEPDYKLVSPNNFEMSMKFREEL